MRDMHAKWAECIQLMLEGNSKMEVARQMDVCRDTVHRWTKKPEFQAMFEKAAHESRGPAWQLLRGLTLRAVETLAVGMHSSDERLRVACATEILDRVGIVKGARIEVDTTQAVQTAEELRERWEALPDAAKALVLAAPQGEQE